MDSTANEIPYVSIKSFPTIVLFLNGDLTKPINYDGDRTAEAFEAFLIKSVPNFSIGAAAGKEKEKEETKTEKSEL